MQLAKIANSDKETTDKKQIEKCIKESGLEKKIESF